LAGEETDAGGELGGAGVELISRQAARGAGVAEEGRVVGTEVGDVVICSIAKEW